MKQLYLILLFFSINIFTQEELSKNLGDFATLKVYNGIEVELIASNDAEVKVSGAKADKLKIKNVNGVLKLSLPFSIKPEENAANGEVIVTLYYRKPIMVVDANEGATITGKGFEQSQLEVNAQERAFINLNIKTKNVKVRTSSGGIIKLTGTTKNQEVDVDLYGTYHGYDLKTSGVTTVKAGTGAKAEVFSNNTINAKVSFGGSIFYKGNPKLIKDKKVIGGTIQSRN